MLIFGQGCSFLGYLININEVWYKLLCWEMNWVCILVFYDV